MDGENLNPDLKSTEIDGSFRITGLCWSMY